MSQVVASPCHSPFSSVSSRSLPCLVLSYLPLEGTHQGVAMEGATACRSRDPTARPADECHPRDPPSLLVLFFSPRVLASLNQLRHHFFLYRSLPLASMAMGSSSETPLILQEMVPPPYPNLLLSHTCVQGRKARGAQVFLFLRLAKDLVGLVVSLL